MESLLMPNPVFSVAVCRVGKIILLGQSSCTFMVRVLLDGRVRYVGFTEEAESRVQSKRLITGS